METKFTVVAIEKPEAVNFILGQTHFIKSVEDIHEALVTTVPGIKLGLAFCERRRVAALKVSKATHWPSSSAT